MKAIENTLKILTSNSEQKDKEIKMKERTKK